MNIKYHKYKKPQNDYIILLHMPKVHFKPSNFTHIAFSGFQSCQKVVGSSPRAP